MSLIVLNSKGQDPAEFENHFGRGIKLPKNAELCLVGSNINYKENTEDETQISENNDTFVVQYGDVATAGLNETGPYVIKIPHGNYKNLDLGSAIQSALFAGQGPTGQENSGWYKNQPVSSIRNGIQCIYDLGTKKLSFTPRAQTVQVGVFGGMANEQDTFTSSAEARRSFFASTGCYRSYGADPSQTDNQLTLGQELPITRLGFDNTYALWSPPADVFETNQTQAILSKYACWTHNTGAAPLLPEAGGWGGSPHINPYWMAGHHWLLPTLSYAQRRDKLTMYMGGLVSQRRVGVTSWGNPVYSANNRQQLIDNWANGGIKYDIWWEVEPDDANTKWIVKYYYHPTNKPYSYDNAIQFGEGQLLQNGDNQISLIPKAGTCGTDPTAPTLPGTDADKFIWEGRYSHSNAVTTYNVTKSDPATLNGQQGYCVVTDGGNFDLYKYLPIYQGCNLKHRDPDAGTAPQTIAISTLRHGNSRVVEQSIYNGQGEPISGPPGVAIANNEAPFRDVYFGFSPVREMPLGTNPFIDNKFRLMVDREANVGKSLGFREDSLNKYVKNTVVTLESSFPATNWSETEDVAIIQLPNVPIEGSLGGGSSVWGGANDAQILGIAPIRIVKNTEISASTENGAVYTEASNENWIKLSNLCMDSLNQLQVKITDPTGRKLKNLSPDTTIWIKIRQGEHDTVLKGGDQPMHQQYGRFRVVN